MYWKQFVGWVTSFHNKYRNDIFFRTGFNIIILQIAFAIVVSVLVAVMFNYLYKDLLQTILDGITENVINSGSFTPSDIVNSIQIVKANNFLNFFAVSVSVTLLFSYIIAIVTLSPTRNALKYQKRFVSDVAHELRTPLSVIKTNNEVALLDDKLDNHSRKVFKSTVEELDRVSAIINNLLTFSNLVHPEQVQFSQVDLSEVVGNVVKKLDELIKKKEIILTVKTTSPSSVLGNITALEQIAINIIKNAINYNHIGGVVNVRVEPDYSGNILFSVEDNGIGISQKDLLHIFEPFYRAERSRNRQSGSSSGLGLTIVSELVKLHSGKISVSSHLKQGTTVKITLPYSRGGLDNMINNEKNNEVSVDYLKRK